MSDASSSPVATSAGERNQALSADAVDAILADFRAWLLESRETLPLEDAPALEVESVLQQFIALRHEVNLQTKASRAQQEQTGQALALLQQSLDRAADQEGQDESLRPLLKTLIDAHDALALAQREVQRLLDQPALGAPSTTSPPVIKIHLPHWAKWFGLAELIDKQLAPLHAWHAAQSQRAVVEPDQRQRQILESLLVGYQMSMQRIERALEQYGLETIACAGEPFDPETMEVAEVVRENGRAGTIVLDEIRRGYTWQGRLFRYAQVRVAKP
jgi:molecular chaperone GrpE